jgi:hypothetical protein
MAKTEKNPNSILFLYEGETEDDFYKKIFKKYVPKRAIRQNFGNLKGVYNVTEKVRNKIRVTLIINRLKIVMIFMFSLPSTVKASAANRRCLGWPSWRENSFTKVRG